MPHSNRDELSRLFGTFCHLWSKGLHANVQMKTTGSGGVVAQFEFELDKPHKSFPAGLPGFRRSQPQRAPRRQPGHETGSPNAPGHPGATGGSRRRPRRRGPKAIERSRLQATAHHMLLEIKTYLSQALIWERWIPFAHIVKRTNLNKRKSTAVIMVKYSFNHCCLIQMT